MKKNNQQGVDEVNIQCNGLHLIVSSSADNDGYMLGIYDQEPTDDVEPIDGGLCTGTIIDAIEMVMSQAGMRVCE